MRLETSRLRFWGTWRYMHNLKRWFYENPIDLAYVSMLKHDAYTVIGAGERLGFPVVLRPEGAGATGDIAWQSWGNFGRTIGRRCRRATAFVSYFQGDRARASRFLSSRYNAASVVKGLRTTATRIHRELCRFPMECQFRSVRGSAGSIGGVRRERSSLAAWPRKRGSMCSLPPGHWCEPDIQRRG